VISRWDAIVDVAMRADLAGIPIRIIFRCERCGCDHLYILGSSEGPIPGRPDVIYRSRVYRCADCGQVEAVATETRVLGEWPL